MVDAVDRIAEVISDAKASGAHLRIAVVSAVAAGGASVQLDAFGTAWLGVDLAAGVVGVGDRVYAIQQGPVVVVAGKLAGSPGGMPVGAVSAYAGGVAPAGWLLCQGQSLDRVAYAGLFAVVGVSYGSASGSTFNLPDLRSRVPVGVATGKALAASGGSETVTLTAPQMPSHSHGSAGSHTHPVAQSQTVASGTGATVMDTTGTGNSTSSSGSHTHSTSGSDAAHPNMQPYLVLNYIIKAT